MAEFTAVFVEEEDGSVDFKEEDFSVDIKEEDGSVDIKEEDGSVDIKEDDGSVDIKEECGEEKDPFSITSQSTKGKRNIECLDVDENSKFAFFEVSFVWNVNVSSHILRLH